MDQTQFCNNMYKAIREFIKFNFYVFFFYLTLSCDVYYM